MGLFLTIRLFSDVHEGSVAKNRFPFLITLSNNAFVWFKNNLVSAVTLFRTRILVSTNLFMRHFDVIIHCYSCAMLWFELRLGLICKYNMICVECCVNDQRDAQFLWSILFHSFSSALHVSKESILSSSAARHNILYYTVQSVQSCYQASLAAAASSCS